MFNDGKITKDPIIDTSSIFGAHIYGLFDSESTQMTSSVEAMVSAFKLLDDEPGIPRYENDPYRRSDPSINGNWWLITTLWHAQYMLEKNNTKDAKAILDWTKSYALSTGMLGEQINPLTNEIIAPAPLTWSHAEYLSTLLDYIEKTKK